MSVSFSRKQLRKRFNGVQPSEIAVIDGVTAGTATASKALVLDASKAISTITTLGATTGNITTVSSTTVTSTTVNTGSNGTAGTLNVWPTTASKGKLAITCTDQTGDTTVSLTIGAMAAARTITLADPGATANIVTDVGIGATQGARCTSAFSATSGDTGTTLTDITGMSVNVLAAGVYAFRAYLPGTGTVNSGGKFAISGTATATSINYTGGQFNDGTCNDTTTTTTLGNAVGAATAAWNYAYIEGTIVVNAAGTLTVQAAQNASHADATTVSVNAYFLVTRIA